MYDTEQARLRGLFVGIPVADDAVGKLCDVARLARFVICPLHRAQKPSTRITLMLKTSMTSRSQGRITFTLDAEDGISYRIRLEAWNGKYWVLRRSEGDVREATISEAEYEKAFDLARKISPRKGNFSGFYLGDTRALDVPTLGISLSWMWPDDLQAATDLEWYLKSLDRDRNGGCYYY